MLAPSRFNEITRLIVAKAIEVHRTLGPGLLDTFLECGYRLDILVEGKVIVEVKAVEQLAPIHQAQMMTYLRLSNCRVGLILNFNAPMMIEGIKRVMNGYEE